MLLARCCTILCGEVFIPWELWTFALQTARASFPQDGLNNISAMSLVQLWSTNRFDARNILDLLAKFASSQTTESHDKIYALLGLADEGDRIHVDYEQSMAAVLLDCLRASGWTVNDVRLFDACKILGVHIEELYFAIDLKISYTKLARYDWDVRRRKFNRNNLRLFELQHSFGAVASSRQLTNLRRSQYVTGFRTKRFDVLRPSCIDYCTCMPCMTAWKRPEAPKMQTGHSRCVWVVEMCEARHLVTPFCDNTLNNQTDHISLHQLNSEGQVGEYLASAVFPARLTLPSERAEHAYMLLYHDPNCHRDNIDMQPGSSHITPGRKRHPTVQSLLLYDHIFWWQQAETRDSADHDQFVQRNLTTDTSLCLTLSNELDVYDLRETPVSFIRRRFQEASDSDSDE